MKNQKPVVLLTRRWPEAVEAALAEKYTLIRNDADVPYSAAELAAAFTQADAVCPTVTDALTADVFAAASKLGIRAKLLANFGVGYNHIDIASARANGLEITNTPGVLTAATAEIAMTLLLMCARRAGEGERLVRNGDWQGWHPTHMLSTQVTGKTLGIVGMGRIGIAMARQAHRGFGMRVVYSGRSRVAESVGLELGAEFLSLDELLATADFVSLHCPATPETRNLIDARALTLMRKDAVLINTARGDVVVEDDLVEALKNAEIAGAGLDVYAHEPSVPAELQAVRTGGIVTAYGERHSRNSRGHGVVCHGKFRGVFCEAAPAQCGRLMTLEKRRA
ncbi:MAG: 2-hydroxyacid dehydrogenase [Candidatus Azotimanducaceae bacterium]